MILHYLMKERPAVFADVNMNKRRGEKFDLGGAMNGARSSPSDMRSRDVMRGYMALTSILESLYRSPGFWEDRNDEWQTNQDISHRRQYPKTRLKCTQGRAISTEHMICTRMYS